MARTVAGSKTKAWKRKCRDNEGEDNSNVGEQMQQGKRKGYSSEEVEGKTPGKKGKSVFSLTNCTAAAGPQPRPSQ